MTAVDIPALKRRYPLGGVVEASGVELKGRGRVRQGVCPFHEETEASFTVYADTQRWYCFGCGLGGDVLDARNLRVQLIELSAAQGFSEPPVRHAVRNKSGRELDELGPAELNPLIASAAEKLERRRQAELD